MWNPLARFLVIVLLCSLGTPSQAAPLSLQVDADGIERSNAPVSVDIQVPGQVTLAEIEAWSKPGPALQPGNVPVQVEQVKDAQGNVTVVRLHWVEPALKADEKKSYTIGAWATNGIPAPFAFVDTETTRDLKLGQRLIWRHDVLQYDPKKHTETFKHFHQIYGFHEDGFITQGIGGKQFPHHRGLYMGWNKTGVDGKNFDTWHCTAGVAIRHREFVKSHETHGFLMNRSTSLADWTAGDGKSLVAEQRAVTTWNLGTGITLMDFSIQLTSGGGDVKLDGDPQHAGFQFRAAGEVGDSKAKYIYPAAVKSKGGDVWADCPWVVAMFAIKGKPYAVAHFDHPKNPGTDEGRTVYSTRNYGRFGAYASQLLKADQPLVFNYRILVLDAPKDSDKSVERIQKLHESWVKPVKVEVKS